MRMYDIIRKKRLGGELTDEEIRFLVSGFVSGSIPDYQMSAFLMAVCFCSMSDRETAILTDAMAHSGDTVDLSCFGENTVDKHSTGGVGDKTTMAVAPIVASCGLVVAKMSGRGLGHTGGTVDKLEAFPGYRTQIDADEFLKIAQKHGIAVVGQSGNLVPADKKMYALRDVTATVDCVPLIASSIMSKKLAAGAHSIVLDVKVGSGSFVGSVEHGRELARKMVDIGNACKRKVAALITDMDVPLGHSVGLICEVKEAIETLRGGGSPDFRELCLAVSSKMLSLSKNIPIKEAQLMAKDALDSGRAYDKFCEWIEGQGGDIRYAKNPSLFPEAKYSFAVKAPCDGYIGKMDTTEIGFCAQMLGAGREKKEDILDFTAGIEILRKTGDKVSHGDEIALLFTSKSGVLDSAVNRFCAAVPVGSEYFAPAPLIYETVG